MRIAWVRDLHQRASGRTVLTAVDVLVAERNSKLACLDAETGGEHWISDVQSAYGSPALTDGRAVYVEPSGTVRCFDSAVGVAQWSRSLEGRFWGHAVPASGSIVVGGWRGYTPLTCLSLADGSTSWELPPGDSFTQPIEFGGHVLAPAPAGGFIAVLDGRTGEVVERLTLPAPSALAVHQVPDVVKDGGRLFICRDGEILALDPSRDADWWRFGSSSDVVSEVPTVAGGLVLVRESSGSTVAFDTDGERLWSLDLVGNSARVFACTVDSATLIASPLGRAVVISRDGEVVNAATVSQRVGGVPQVTASGAVLMIGKGTVFAVDVGDVA